MNQKQKRRLFGIICLVVILSLAASLILYALKQNINLFYTPTQLLQAPIQTNQHVRIGGYVKNHSVKYDNSGQGVSFIVTDNHHDLFIQYHGVLPNLFREGQGVVVTGKINAEHLLLADEVLAKHDEKYMPWPLAKELKKGDSRGT
jgi:cytochrome c-type biogenesis protein CcmE